MVLFLIFGWSKLTSFSDALNYMAAEGTPLPTIAAIIAIVMEFFVGIALVIGFYTRPLTRLFAVYTLGTGFIGHHFWTMTDGARMVKA